MYILGISCFYHDAASCLLKDGKILSAAQEERFTRKKHDYSFPKASIEYCLKEAGINVHYLYPYLGRTSDQAIVILGVDKTEEAEKVLRQNWVHTLGKEIYNL